MTNANVNTNVKSNATAAVVAGTRKLFKIETPSKKDAARKIFNSIFYPESGTYTLPDGVKSQRADFIKQCVEHEVRITPATAATYYKALMDEANGNTTAQEKAREAARQRRLAAKQSIEVEPKVAAPKTLAKEVEVKATAAKPEAKPEAKAAPRKRATKTAATA